MSINYNYLILLINILTDKYYFCKIDFADYVFALNENIVPKAFEIYKI